MAGTRTENLSPCPAGDLQYNLTQQLCFVFWPLPKQIEKEIKLFTIHFLVLIVTGVEKRPLADIPLLKSA